MDPETAERVLEQIGLRISELRAKAGLTQAQAAERLEMTLSNYQRVEHGGQNLTVRTLVRVANVLGVRTAEFMATPSSQFRTVGRPKR